MYLRRNGWTDADTFSIETAAGEIRPTITGERTCRVDMGRARLTSKDFPSGPEDGTGALESGGREWRFQHVSVGNPQCAIRMDDVAELEALDLTAYGPGIEHHDLFPNRTNVSWFAARSSPALSGRASSSAAWARRCPRAPARVAPRSPTRCAAATRR